MAKVTTTLFGDVAVLPFKASQPLRHTLRWVTDVFESHNGSESAIQLRETPRESLTFSMKEKQWQKSEGFLTEYGGIDARWAMPLWHEEQQLGNVAAAVTALACDTDNYDFRDESLALLVSPLGTYKVIEIDTVGSGVLNLVSGTTQQRQASLVPLRVGRITDKFSRKASGFDVYTDVHFESDETLLLEPDVPEQFLGNDIYFQPPIKDGLRMTYDVSKRIDVADYDIGPVSTRSPWTNSRVARPFNVVTETLAEAMAFKLWAYRRAGKFRRFWEPSFENDLRLLSTAAMNSSLIVARDGMTEWPQRLHIAVELEDGSWLPRTVSSYANLDATRTQINLTSTLGGILPNLVRRISWLGLKRLDADMIEMNWIGNGVMRSSVQTLELQP